MADTPAFLAERLKIEGEKFFDIFSALHDADWQMEVYTEGTTWTIRNVLAHFVTAEMGFLKLFPSILNGSPGSSEDFDIDRYNARQQEKTKDLTPQELLEQYRVTRAAMVAWVGGLSEDDLSKEGRHPFLGYTTLNEMIKLVYRHNQIHYRDFRKLLPES